MKLYVMKNSVFILLLLTSFLVRSQKSDNRIRQVENGLIFPSIVSVGQEMTQYNILNQMKKYKIHGVSVAVVHNGKLDWSKAYGFVDKEHSKPITKQTLFQSASIGKMITALVALRLVQEGKLDLDTNVNDQLKRWKLPENDLTQKQPVTLRHLLSHTSGLTDDYGFLGYKPSGKIPTLLNILNNQSPAKTKKKLQIKTTPGTVERYSGAGYLILQLLIEDSSGLSFEKAVQNYIFDPLNMSNSTYDYQPDINLQKKIAFGHLANGKSLKKKRYHIYPEKAAAGPWTTAVDLAKLILGIQHHQVLNVEITQEMMTPFINHKGLGVNLKGIHQPHVFWHAGQNLGYTGLLFGSLDQKNGAVILLNSDGGEQLMQEFISSVASAYKWKVMRAFHSQKISSEKMNLLSGMYQDENSDTGFSINLQKGRLFVKPIDSKKSIELHKIGDNHFTFKDAQDYYKIVFIYTNGQVSHLHYSQSIGHSIHLKKQ